MQLPDWLRMRIFLSIGQQKPPRRKARSKDKPRTAWIKSEKSRSNVTLSAWFFAILGYAIAITTAVSVTFDIYALHQFPPVRTVSGAIFRWVQANPAVGPPFVAAMLFGTAAALWLHFCYGLGIDE